MNGLYHGTIFYGVQHIWGGELVWFSTHSQLLKGYPGFTNLTKNQPIGVSYSDLHTLVWISEHVTDWPFAGPLSDF